jgi:hypothetical protein
MYDRIDKKVQQKKALGNATGLIKSRLVAPCQFVDNRPVLRKVQFHQISNNHFLRQHTTQNKNLLYQPSTTLSIIQRLKAQLGNPAIFEVDKNDMSGGTPTSIETREYVNEPKTPKHGTINWSYSIPGTKIKDSGTASNPSSIKSNGRWDAGHLLGRQNGGKGDINSWVFPQNPQINRGNYDDADNPTYVDWRGVENTFHDNVNTYGKGIWQVSLT